MFWLGNGLSDVELGAFSGPACPVRAGCFPLFPDPGAESVLTLAASGHVNPFAGQPSGGLEVGVGISQVNDRSMVTDRVDGECDHLKWPRLAGCRRELWPHLGSVFRVGVVGAEVGEWRGRKWRCSRDQAVRWAGGRSTDSLGNGVESR